MEPQPSHDLRPLPRTVSNPYAELLASVRHSARLTRAELSARVGAPEHTVALWEDPAFEGVDLSILGRVARATGREVDVRFRPVRREELHQESPKAQSVDQPAPLRNLQAS